MTKNIRSFGLNRVYEKANSFVALSGTAEDSLQFNRLQKLRDGLRNDPSKEAILVARACNELLNPEDEDCLKFELKPFILEEMQRLNNKELFRYIYYRYRYEIYPPTQQLDSFPRCVQIEPTSICNYRCVFCYQTDPNLTQGRHGHMDMMVFPHMDSR